MKDEVNILISDPELSKYWSEENTLNISEVSRGRQDKAWWNCPSGEPHAFERCINKFLNGQSKCPYCENIKLLIGFNDLKTRFPKLSKEYSNNNILKANEIIFNSTKKVEWIGLDCQHKLTATVNSRIIPNNNCPYCSRNKVMEGFNDLLTTHPEASLYWNYKKNKLKITEVSRGSNKMVWWINPNCGHSFQKSIKHHKLDGSQCPECPRVFSRIDNLMKRCQKDNSKVHLVNEWDYKKNSKGPEDIGAYSLYKAWWICSECSHSWQATVTNRFKGNNCPKCWRSNSNFEKKIYEYLQESYNGEILRNKRPMETSSGSKRELDFWLPELNLAFEVNDLATHSKYSNEEFIDFNYEKVKETFKKGPLYHQEKIFLAKEQLNCDLFFIWEDEIFSGEYKNIINEILSNFVGINF